MKRKTRKATRSVPAEADWLEDQPSVPGRRHGKASLDDLAANIEKGIRDLPVWKDYVRRFGLRKTRQLLRQGFLIRLFTDGNPQN